MGRIIFSKKNSKTETYSKTNKQEKARSMFKRTARVVWRVKDGRRLISKLL
jgi:hypothetical protein